MSFDSRPETWQHIHRVQMYLGRAIQKLMKRQHVHDQSKLASPEVELFDEHTQTLKGLTYGSPEYFACLKSLQPALDHHYANNSHHPEFHQEGIRGMTLLDLTELLADWKAASERHADGDIRKSIEINQKRFGYSDELKQIFLNSLKELETD